MIGLLHIAMFFAAIYVLRAVFVRCFGGGEK